MHFPQYPMYGPGWPMNNPQFQQMQQPQQQTQAQSQQQQQQQQTQQQSQAQQGFPQMGPNPFMPGPGMNQGPFGPYQQNPYFQGPGNMPQKPIPPFLTPFTSENGKFDINKTTKTVDQVVKTWNQAAPLVKQVGTLFGVTKQP
ncbi:YppG family protein [Alkalihalobacillus sp. LMS39]|uniref:YppG family protein n=1 Tax=Alkalihalobacillus sp. LMS39 TaxID=2924032 RepID=UPI001FB4977C|nr:YppG family protein [Alkalihalobacillus sp. LMS39]UOE92624.1 YppG family protein [Alkalihalobacillus sp. LMS39]